MTPWAELLEYHPHPEVWALVVGVAGLYAAALRGHRHRIGRAGSCRHVARFLTGLALLWAALDWPIDDLSDNSLLSVHMIQYLLLAMLAPLPLLTPTRLADRPGAAASLAPRPRTHAGPAAERLTGREHRGDAQPPRPRRRPLPAA